MDGEILRPTEVVTRPTTAGRVLLVVALVAFLLGAAGFGSAFALVAALAGAVAAVAAFAARRRAATLRLRPPGPTTATARERFVLRSEVVRSVRGTSYDVTAAFRDARGGRRVAGFLPRVASDAATTLDAVHPPLRRGRHRPLALDLESSGPLGLVRCRATFDLPHDVLVLPRLGTVRGLGSDAARHRDAAAPTARGRAEGEEFHDLRAWREGEGLRRVHWKSSARRGRLVVRELRGEPQAPVHVVLVAARAKDARGARADFEGAVALAATLVDHHVRRDHAVRLTILGRDLRAFAPRRGKGAVLPILRELAEVEAAPEEECRGLDALPRETRPGERTFVARAGGVGGPVPSAARGVRTWRVLDVGDPAIGAVFVRGRTATTSAPSSGGPAEAGPADVVRRADRALRTVVWTSIAAAALAVVVAGARLLFPGEDGLLAGDFPRRAALLSVLLATAGFQAFSAWMRGHDRATLLRALWTTQSLALAAAAVADALPATLLVPLVLAMLLAGLSLSHAATVRETALRALRGRTAISEDASAAGRRARAGAALAVPVLVVAALLFPPLREAPDFLRVEWARMSGAAEPPGARGSAVGGSGASATVVIDPTAHGLGAGELENRLLLEMVPSHRGRVTGSLGPLYLRGATLVEVDARGRWIDPDVAPPEVRDRDDGREDGWCILRSPAPAEDAYVDLTVRQALLQHGPTGLVILHAPPGTVAVARPRVLHEPEGALLSDVERGSPVHYRLRALRTGQLPWPTDATPRGSRDARALEFPSRHVSSAALAAEAAEVTDDHTTDLARVRAVVRHLRETYAYERLSDVEDADDAMEAFVTGRRGSCVQFAQAAALMLRSRGIPARVATGLLVREWNPERGVYRAFGRDYHAWVEVDFEGCGWVVFDPTPVAPGADAAEEGAAAAAALDRDADVGGGLDAVVRRIGAGAARAARVVRDAVREHAWPWGLVSLVVTVVVGLLLARHRGAAPAESPVESGHPAAWARLLSRLARRGLRRAPTETALEFAARVVAAEGDRLAEFVPLTFREQAARYGARPLTDEDERAIDALRRAV